MSDIIDLQEYRDSKKPQVIVNAPNGNVHIIPVELLEELIEGTISITDVEEWDQVVRGIIRSWLELII